MVTARGATTTTVLAAALALAGCSWRLPQVTPLDAGIDVAPVDDVPVDAADAVDAHDAHDAVDVPQDVPQDVQATCPGAADMTAVRVAHLVPDLGAVDLCIAHASDTSGAFNGPVLVHDQFLAGGVAYQQLTGYFALEPDTYTFRLVAVGAADCTTRIAGTVDATLTVLPRTYSTLALMGLAAGTPAATTRLYGDTHTSSGMPGEQPQLRVIHAAPDVGQVEVRVTFSSTTLVAGRASFGDVGLPPTGGFISADCNGYFRAVSGTPIPVGVFAPPTATSPLVSFSTSLSPAEVASGFLTGTMGAISPHGPQILVCDDRTTVGGYAPCMVLP